MPGRHCVARACSATIVSTISIGAGSVAVLARPILPNTRSTSGNSFSSRSMRCSTLAASVADMPGGAVGM